MGSPLRLIVGLGNPKPSYDQTRHNVGREFIDYLLKESDSRFSKSRQTEQFRLPAFFGLDLEKPLICTKLLCYMNESGPPLKKLISSDGIKPNQVLVVFDDFMIPFGSLRLRLKGSAGGHNGVQSIIDAFGSNEFPRLRVGIGPTPDGQDPADFVLKKFSKTELSKLPDLFSAAKDAISVFLSQGDQKAMGAANKQHL